MGHFDVQAALWGSLAIKSKSNCNGLGFDIRRLLCFSIKHTLGVFGGRPNYSEEMHKLASSQYSLIFVSVTVIIVLFR